MLSINGSGFSHCDGVSRRSFLTVGGLAMGGLSLPQLLQAEAKQKIGHSHKSVIMVFLSGGPPHQDMVDLKPNAPAEYRGEFSPIETNVPGIEICWNCLHLDEMGSHGGWRSPFEHREERIQTADAPHLPECSNHVPDPHKLSDREEILP